MGCSNHGNFGDGRISDGLQVVNRGARLHGLTTWGNKAENQHPFRAHSERHPAQERTRWSVLGARFGQAGCGQVTKDWNGEPRDGRVDLALGVPELEGMAWHQVG
jgi:hypothetical protein